MASTLAQLNSRIEERRDQVAWNLERFLFEIRRRIQDGTLKEHLSDLIYILECYRPRQIEGTAVQDWIGYDSYDNVVLTDHYQLVTLDYDQMLLDLKRLRTESRQIADPNYVVQQAEWLFENVWDRHYSWE